MHDAPRVGLNLENRNEGERDLSQEDRTLLVSISKILQGQLSPIALDMTMFEEAHPGAVSPSATAFHKRQRERMNTLYRCIEGTLRRHFQVDARTWSGIWSEALDAFEDIPESYVDPKRRPGFYE